MHRRNLVIGLGAAALAACSPPMPEQAPQDIASAAGPDPADTIRPLYERYRTDPAATTFPTLLEQAPWSARLRGELEAMQARSQAAGEPVLDFDPFVNAQDWHIEAVNVASEGVVYGSHASVRVSFTNAGFTEEVVHDLVWEGGAWRVDNIRGKDWDLRQLIAR